MSERREMIQMEHDLPVSRRCELLDVARSTAYYQPKDPPSESGLALKRAIDEIHLELPFYGSRRLVDELADRGHADINRKRVQRLMREMGLVALYPKRRTSRSVDGHKVYVYPYLLGTLSIERPNQVWAADICYPRDHPISDSAPAIWCPAPDVIMILLLACSGVST